MKRCAFLTLRDRGDFVIDDELAVEPLARLGWSVDTVCWQQRETPWNSFDLVVIRSTWDYWNDVPGFLEVLSRIDRQTRLANPLDLVHWNLSKSYLRDLAGKDVGVVETLWLDEFRAGMAVRCAARLGADRIVVKPVIGANGEDAFLIDRTAERDELKRVAARFRGRACMVQPFMDKVLTEGEYSLFYFGGAFSHAILKVPAAGEFRSQEERGAEIRSVVAGERLRLRGQRALQAVSPAPLYARVDLVRNGASDFEVMELELIEPSLYLRTDPAAPERFAQAVDTWVRPG